MLKLFLVEDEMIIREGIKNKIKWEDYGFTFVGEASDGELALPLIQKLKPDVLITDIKMPFMNGLELSKLVKKEIPNIKIIILSGYNEFEYAKEAIGIGVTDYLLKPVSSIKITEVILKVKNLIEDEKKQILLKEQYDKEMEENKNQRKSKILSSLLSQKVNITEVLENSRDINVDLIAEEFNILIFSFFKENSPLDVYSKDMIDAENTIIHIFSNLNEAILFNDDFGNKVILLKNYKEYNIKAITSKYINDLVNVFEKNKDLGYFIGIGNPVKRLTDVKKSFNEASKAFALRHVFGINQVIHYNDIEYKISNSQSISIEEINTFISHKKKIEMFLKFGTVDSVSNFIDNYFELIDKDNMNSYLFRQYIVIDVLLMAYSFLDEIGLNKDIIKDINGNIHSKKLLSIKNTKEYLVSVLNEVLLLRDISVSKKYSTILNEAKKYIDKNYQDPDISLNAVSEFINISPSYLSSLFSREIGKTFIEYLTTLRMNKAKELLRCTNLRSSEIAYSVGYKDSHYFSFLFKKLEKKTPREYRTGGF